jgi:DNA-directed RNA polymerase specialized sigma24 family protein
MSEHENAGARAWALSDEQARALWQSKDFDGVVRTIDAELLRDARIKAWQILRTHDVDDAISDAWVRVLPRYDRTRGGIRPLFFTVLRTVCIDRLRAGSTEKKKMSPLPGDDALLGEAAYHEVVLDIADEVIDEMDDTNDRIIAAIEVLDLNEKQRGMLRRLLDDEASAPDDPAAAQAALKAANIRQQVKRLRGEVDGRVGLTPDEIRAASLLRTRHTVAAAAAAAPDLDVPGLLASAKRKVRAMFNIVTED